VVGLVGLRARLSDVRVVENWTGVPYAATRTGVPYAATRTGVPYASTRHADQSSVLSLTVAPLAAARIGSGLLCPAPQAHRDEHRLARELDHVPSSNGKAAAGQSQTSGARDGEASHGPLFEC
jgi:hypothetical protein